MNTTSSNQTPRTPLSTSPGSMLAAVCVLACLSQSATAQNTGINFPPQQGSSGTGCFLPGIYNYTYSNTQIYNSNPTFNMMRLPINVETANDPASLTKLQGYVNQFAGHYAIICMFDTLLPGQTGHGDGKPNNLTDIANAWAKIHAVFSSYPNIHYEIFNEPFGYSKSNPVAYVNDMKTIISRAGLPSSKCILDGMGYADNINLVAAGGWTGDLAYHFYPTWLSSNFTQSNYSNKAQADLGSWGQKTWVTEFGANLGYNNACYDQYDDGTHYWSPDVNCLRGLDDALRALRANGHGVKGAFYWHGWHNNDSYDFWASFNANGACKVREIETHD